MKTFYRLVTILAVLAAQVAFAQTPPAPTNLSAQVGSTNRPGVQLKWDFSAPITRTMFFKVYRSVDDQLNFGLLSITMVTNYRDDKVTAGHTYYYYVTAATFSGLTLAEGTPSDTVNATLTGPIVGPRGTISGTVIDSISGKPIPNARIQFFCLSKTILWIPQASTDANGFYKAVLDTGTYLLNATAVHAISASVFPMYRPEWYKNAPDPRSATPVKLTEGATFTADFDLVPFVIVPPKFAKVSGTVTDESGKPLEKATVVVARTMQELHLLASLNDFTPGTGTEGMHVEWLGYVRGVLWKGFTDAEGKYTASVPDTNSYVAMAVKAGYLPEYYKDKTSPLDADIIKVAGDVRGIDFSLALRPVPQNTISGVVSDSDGVRVPARIVLLPVQRTLPSLKSRFQHTDSLGQYKISNVLPGKYLVLALPFSNYAPAFYKKGAYGVIHWKNADTVEIPMTGDVSGIDIGVVQIRRIGFARLLGKITAMGGSPEELTGNPIEGVSVLAKNVQGDIVGYGITDERGAYVIESLPAGQISVHIDRPDYLPKQDAITVGVRDVALTKDYVLVPLNPTGVSDRSTIPVTYALDQNYPNPFNPSTEIRFALPVQSTVTLRIYSLIGQEVATLLNGSQEAGTYHVTWNGMDDAGHSAASGLYFYTLNASPTRGGEGFRSTKKMLLVR